MIRTQENGETKFGTQIFFFQKIWLRQSLDIMVSYHHVQYQKKLMIQPSENLVPDGQTNGQTDRWTRVISYDTVRLTSSLQSHFT